MTPTTRRRLPLIAAIVFAVFTHARADAPPLACPRPDASETELMGRINALRAQPRSCGGRFFPAARPLAWNSVLYQAARMFAEDMARQDYFSHKSPDGGSAGERLEEAGYRWKSLGENIAFGQHSVAEALSAWLNSSSHCQSLMAPQFRDVALGCSEAGGRLYWVLELGEAGRQ